MTLANFLNFSFNRANFQTFHLRALILCLYGFTCFCAIIRCMYYALYFIITVSAQSYFIVDSFPTYSKAQCLERMDITIASLNEADTITGIFANCQRLPIKDS